MRISDWSSDVCSSDLEALLGYDGLSIAVSRKGEVLNVTKEQLFLALASEVPQTGKVVANPYTKWSEIDSSLPDIKNQVFGPPPTSGTRDACVELVMPEGCGSFAELTATETTRDLTSAREGKEI